MYPKFNFLEIITDLSAFESPQPMAISLGMFDGVHRGHDYLIHELDIKARQKGYMSGIFSFWPHPRKILEPEFNIQLLTNLEEKQDLLSKKNIDFLFLQEFNEKLKNIEAKDFVKDILIKKLNAKYIIVGHDHRFGKNRQGDFNTLKKIGKECGVQVEQLASIDEDGQTISSTKTRKMLLEGKVKKANDMLGYFYSISGEVIHGKKIGRTIGYPTANILVDRDKLLPQKGAYIVEVWIRNHFYKGMLSIGTNPTVGGEEVSVEVYILDFNQNIYGEQITLKFREFLHEEINFDSLDKLIEKLNEDEKITEQFLF